MCLVFSPLPLSSPAQGFERRGEKSGRVPLVGVAIAIVINRLVLKACPELQRTAASRFPCR
jgi:hypothetical protein